MGGNFKIRVVENIGNESFDTFGKPGTVCEVTAGTLIDSENYKWFEDFKNLDDVHRYFDDSCFKTKFELVEEE